MLSKQLDDHSGHLLTLYKRCRVQKTGARVFMSMLTFTASPAATTPIPLPRASLSFLVKQPGGLGYKLHSKCS